MAEQSKRSRIVMCPPYRYRRQHLIPSINSGLSPQSSALEWYGDAPSAVTARREQSSHTKSGYRFTKSDPKSSVSDREQMAQGISFLRPPRLLRVPTFSLLLRIESVRWPVSICATLRMVLVAFCAAATRAQAYPTALASPTACYSSSQRITPSQVNSSPQRTRRSAATPADAIRWPYVLACLAYSGYVLSTGPAGRASVLKSITLSH